MSRYFQTQYQFKPTMFNRNDAAIVALIALFLMFQNKIKKAEPLDPAFKNYLLSSAKSKYDLD